MAKEYSTSEITIIWQPEKCIHSGNCVRLLPNVYHPKETLWVKPENATTQQLVDQINQCPSGALSYRVNIVGSRSPYPGIGDYAATKAALAAYTRSWARDLGRKNITVNIIQPGLIDTDMNPADGQHSSAMLQSVALGRYGNPTDIGAAVAFLASDDAQYITGVTLNVDGGQTT